MAGCAEEEGAQAPKEKMTLADWHNLQSPEVAAKFKIKHLKEFLASLPDLLHRERKIDTLLSQGNTHLATIG